MMAERLPEEELAQSSQRGRPTIEVDPEEVKFLLSKGFTKTKNCFNVTDQSMNIV